MTVCFRLAFSETHLVYGFFEGTLHICLFCKSSLIKIVQHTSNPLTMAYFSFNKLHVKELKHGGVVVEHSLP